MILYVSHHKYHYELENICRIFLPFEELTVTESDIPTDGDFICVTENNAEISAQLSFKGKTESRHGIFSPLTEDNELVIESALMLYSMLSSVLEYKPSWGILTGVRPSKLMRTLISQKGEDEAREYFQNRLLVTEEKTNLAVNVTRQEEKIIELSKPQSFSLYVSIPFCPTRCSYCSFVSHSIESAKHLIPPYIDRLCEEIAQTARIADWNGLKLSTIYFGGGTPTSFTGEQLDKITHAVAENFDLSDVLEYTVEAGRPDTITDEKLAVLKNAGVGRISINPQTFNDEVLKVIGRNHDSKMTLSAYENAKKYGFDINMDLIAGLPSDTVDSFKNSIDTAISLNPANITVHTLALKRASTLVSQYGIDKDTGDTLSMLDYSAKRLYDSGYLPYYMYRQSRSIGNLENTGWSIPGKECLYNVYMMEEIHTVLAVGGGAVTKLVNPYKYKIDRVFNFKFPYEYIDRFEQITARKQAVNDFYSEVKK